jgi:hypothetical protein
VLAFPQADLEIPVYMELPIGFDPPEGEYYKSYVLRLNKSLYVGGPAQSFPPFFSGGRPEFLKLLKEQTNRQTANKMRLFF